VATNIHAVSPVSIALSAMLMVSKEGKISASAITSSASKKGILFLMFIVFRVMTISQLPQKIQ
jgi:hypothetical protein